MAENDKSQMDAEVRAALAGFKNLTWHTRTGAPHCVSDLEGIAAGQAQTVILLHPETIEVWTAPHTPQMVHIHNMFAGPGGKLCVQNNRGAPAATELPVVVHRPLVGAGRRCVECLSHVTADPSRCFNRWSGVCGAQGAGRKQVAAVMGIQTARSSTVARPFMRLKPQNIAVQVPLNPADAEVRVLLPCQGLGF
jgi:hypothetical protein